jgi:lipoate-protein ligase A
MESVRYQDIISQAVSNYGLEVTFNGRNDLLINGKKFSGNAFYDNGQVCCQHGTLLVNTDIDKMTYYLTPDKSKLERNHIKSVYSRVLNLSEVNSEITIDNLKEQLVLVTKGTELNVNVDTLELKEEINYFSSREWLYGGVR